MTLWMANLEKLKTGNFLLDKGIIDVQQALCPLCNLVVESNSHVLFTCRFAWGTWMEILKSWGIIGVLHDSCNKFISEWFGLMRSRKWKKLWSLILGCVIWSLWYMRNKVIFDSCELDFHKFMYTLHIRIGVWAKELLGSNDGASQGLIQP